MPRPERTGHAKVFIGLAILCLAICASVILRPSPRAWPILDGHPGQPVAIAPAQADPPLEIRFLGTSSLSVSDGKDRILIDGYFSRPGLWSLLAQKLEPDLERIDQALARAEMEQISAVLVAHTHFDHALDAPVLARRFNARLLGSETLAQLAQAEASQLEVEVLSDRQSVQIGDFHLTALITPHAPGDIAAGDDQRPLSLPARARDYPMGTVHSFLIQHGTCRMLVLPSAGQVGPQLADIRADIVFLGIGNLARQGPEATANYWNDTVAATEAALVIPIHWDDFTRPLSQELKPLPYAIDRFDITMKRLTALADEDQVVLALPPLFEAMDLSLPAPAYA